MSDQPLWSPSPERVEATQVMAFLREANRAAPSCLQTYRDLHAWTVQNPDLFWDQIWDFCGVIGDKGAPPRHRRRQDAGRALLPRCAAQLRRKPAAPEATTATRMVFRGEDKASSAG